MILRQEDPTVFAYFEQNTIADANGEPYSVHKKDIAYEAVVYPNEEKTGYVILSAFVIIILYPTSAAFLPTVESSAESTKIVPSSETATK